MRHVRQMTTFGAALALGCALACGSVRAGEPAPAEGSAKEWQVFPLLPAETLFTITVKDLQKASELGQQTGLWKIASSPEVLAAFKGPLLMARGSIVVAEQKLGARVSQLLASVQGELTFSVLGFLSERNEKGERIPDLFVAFQPRDKAQAWMELWQRFVDRLVQQTENQLQISQTRVGGADLVTLSVPGFPIQIQYTLFEGVFMASMGYGRIERILALKQLVQAKGPASAADPEHKTLSGVAAFRTALEQAGPAAQAVAYLNVEELRKVPEAKFNPVTDRERTEWDLAGLSGVKAAAYTLGFQGGALSETLLVACPPGQRTGLWKLLDGPALPAGALGRASSQALAAIALQAPPDELLGRILELSEQGDPAKHQQTLAALERASAALKLDLRKDVLAALDGQALLTLGVPAPAGKLAWGFPRPVLTLGVKDQAAAAKALDAVRRATGGAWEYAETVHRGQVLVTAKEREPKREATGHFCWALERDRLLFSLFPLAVREELDRQNPDPGAGTLGSGALTLSGDPAFQSVSARLGSSPRAAFYLDAAAAANALYDFFVPLGQLTGKGPPGVELHELPTAAAVARNLGPTLIAASCDTSGLRLESHSSTGLFSTLVPAVAALHHRIEARRQRRDAQPAGPEQEAARVAQRQTLRELGKVMAAFAKDNGGALPAGLKDLVPKYIKEQDAGTLDQLSYLGKREAGNRVVAYFTPLDGVGGPTPVLLQDLTVREVSEGHLAKVLMDGYNDTAKAAEPVKPPQAPPDF